MGETFTIKSPLEKKKKKSPLASSISALFPISHIHSCSGQCFSRRDVKSTCNVRTAQELQKWSLLAICCRCSSIHSTFLDVQGLAENCPFYQRSLLHSSQTKKKVTLRIAHFFKMLFHSVKCIAPHLES